MAALGFDPEDFDEDDTIEVWDCNAEAFHVFNAMCTQWREGFAGRTGLDYSAVPVIMDMVSVDKENRPTVFSEVCIMERAALEQMAEDRDNG